jgi:4-hydroxy-2-oxoheptanedioate aldolase
LKAEFATGCKKDWQQNMILNTLKKKWKNGEATLNGWLSIGNSFTAEIMAQQGYDSLTIDIQHGFLDYNDAKGMLQAIRASRVTPMVRVPWLDPGIIMKSLDAGAYGIICPMINTSDQASVLVDAIRYPPHGSRSFGPTRANISAGENYASEANENVVSFAMIETAEAVENIDAICATKGLDGIYIGPADLTLGVTKGRLAPGFDREEPEMIDVIKRILVAAKSQNIHAGIHCGTPQYAAKAVGWGFDLTTISGDVRLLAASAGVSVNQTHELIGSDVKSGFSDAKNGY